MSYFSLSRWLKSVSNRLHASRYRRRPQRVANRLSAVELLESRSLLTAQPWSAGFEAIQPPGSLIHGGTQNDHLDHTGDTDSFSLTLSAGQTVTAALLPEGGVRGRLSIVDPFGATLGSVDGASAGDAALVQTIAATTTGTYEIQVESLSGAGDYEIGLVLNAALEEEPVLESSNNDLGSAQHIDGSLIALPLGGVRAAAVGTAEAGHDDWYSFSLASGQSATLTLSDHDNQNLDLWLYDSSGAALARGVIDYRTFNGESIERFAVETTGTYFARVQGLGDYTLVVSADAELEREPNDRYWAGTALAPGAPALGSLNQPRGIQAYSGTTRVAVHGGANAQIVVDQLNDFSYRDIQAVLVTGAEIDTVEELAAYDVVVLGDADYEAELEMFAPALRTWVEDYRGGVVGTGWLIQAAGADTGEPVADIDAVIPIDTTVFSNTSYVPTIVVNDPSHPVVEGASEFTVNSGFEYSYGSIDSGATILATATFGEEAVVVGTPGAGRSVWLGFTYFDGSYSTYSGDADRLLEQAVTWAGAHGPDRVDFYRFFAAGGDQVVLTTATPGAGFGDALPLNPVLELYGLDGVTLLASDDNSAADGRNAEISYTIPDGDDGSYYVRVAGTAGRGDYQLQVDGATEPQNPPLTVQYSYPGFGVTQNAFPNLIYLNFSSPLLLTELSPSDILLNNQPAASYNVISGTFFSFEVSSLAAGDGTYTIEVFDSAVRNIRGQYNDEFFTTFTVDTVGPVVVESSIAPDDLVAPGPLTFTARFDEALTTYDLGPEDVRLVNNATAEAIAPRSLVYDSEMDRVTVDFDDVPSGSYTLSLISSFSGFRDSVGNPLNGAPSFPLPSGDGNPESDDFSVTFSVDTDILPYPTPLTPVAPLGSLIYDPTVASAFHATGDVDSYTIDLDAGQSVSLVLSPSALNLAVRLELFAPGGSSLGSVEGIAGANVVLQSIFAGDSGTYQIQASSLSGAGDYRLELTLNAAVEDETYTGIPNDSLATAQDLGGSFISPGPGISRGAVVGRIGSGENAALNRTVTLVSGSVDGTGLETLVDGAFVERETGFTDGTVYWFGTDPTLEIDLGAPVSISAARVQADNNDEYLLEYLDGADDQWKALWAVPNYESLGLFGMVTRPDYPFTDADPWHELGTTVTTSRVRFRAVSGDDAYAVSEIQLRTGSTIGSDSDYYAVDLVAGEATSLVLTELEQSVSTSVFVPGSSDPWLAGMPDGSTASYFDTAPDQSPVLVTGLPLTAGGVLTFVVTGSVSNDSDPPSASPDGEGFEGHYTGAENGISHAYIPLNALVGVFLDDSQPDLTGAPDSLDYSESGIDFDSVAPLLKQVFFIGDGRTSGDMAQSFVVPAGATRLFLGTMDGFGWSGNLGGFQVQVSTTATAGSVALELQNEAGDLLALGATGATNVTSVIQPFVPEVSGRYYARVSGAAGTSYSLVVTRGAEFNTEPNDNPAAAMDIGQSHHVLGAIGGQSGGGGAIRVAVHDAGQGAAVRDQLNDDTYFNFEAVSVSGSQIDTLEELQAFDVVVIADYFAESDLASFAPALRAWVEAGGGVVATGWTVYAAGPATGATVTDLDAIIPVQLASYYSFIDSPTIDIQDSTHPVTQGLSDFAPGGTYSEYSPGGIDAGATILATANGTATVVVGAPGNGRAAYLGLTYLYSFNATNSLRSGSADRLLEQAVAWGASGDREDHYLVQANAGDHLVISTTTPGDGAGEPVNELDPIIELYGPDGTLLASNDNSAPDGRNGLLDYVVPSEEGGTYRIVVRGAAGNGEYTLAVEGATGAPQPFQAVATSPADGALLAGFPDVYRVDFSHSVLLTSVDASDLTVDGMPASSVQVIDGDTLEFTILGLQHGDALYHVAIASGALTSISGLSLEEFNATFDADIASPVIVESSLDEGQTLGTGDLTYVVRFSEELATAGLGAEDVVLVDGVTGESFVPFLFSYDAATSTATVTYHNLREGEYTLQLNSSSTAFRDRRGNLLDGSPSFPLPSGDGTAGDAFLLHFRIDVGSENLPANFESLPPGGSLVYATPMIAGHFHAAGDQDEYLVHLEAGQFLGLLVVPADLSLRAQIELVGPEGGSVVVAAPAAGEAAMLHTAAVETTGHYLLRFSALEGSGEYSFQAVLNALWEGEEADGSANDDTSAAQPLGDSMLPLPAGASRLAVVGRITSTGAADQDVYSFVLTGQQVASLVLAAHTSSQSPQLELLDNTGAVVALGTTDVLGAQRVDGFLPAANATYLARVRGLEGMTYTLLVTRGAAFDHEPNSPREAAQPLDSATVALGALGRGSGTLSTTPGNTLGLPRNLFDSSGFRWDIQGDGNINDGTSDAYDGGLVHQGFPFSSTAQGEDGDRELQIGPATIGAVQVSRKVYVPADQAFARFLEIVTNPGSSAISYTVPIYTNLGSDGFEPFVRSSSGDSTVNTSDNWVITDDNDGSGDPTLIHVVAGPDGRIRPSLFSKGSGEVRYSYALTLQPGETQIVMHIAAQNANRATALAKAPQLEALELDVLSGLSPVERDLIVNFNAGGLDYYRFAANEGDVLTLTTATPGGGPGEFQNLADPALELSNPLGFVVASDESSAGDGRNAQVSYVVPTGGAGLYTVLVRSTLTGEYTLTVNGATGNDLIAPFVKSTTPADGQKLASPPTTLTLKLSESILLGSVQAADLSVDGGAIVSDVEMLDGQTVQFTIDVPDTEGLYHYTLAAGAFIDLQGLSSLAFAGSFEIDHTSPSVVSQAPELQASAPFNEISFTFDEALNAASVSTADLTSFTGPDGGSLLGTVSSVQASGNVVTVRFSNRTVLGTYSFTLGPAITDVVGNAMTSSYAGIVQLQSPDLEAFQVSAPPTGVFGSQITVDWIVRNIGSDPARESWSDRVYLSRDTTYSGDDLLLLTNAAAVNPLAAGDQYSKSKEVTLPLSTSYAAGSYYLLVVADALNRQPESSETNNVRASSAISLSLPPIPDLVVTEITAPIEALSGQPMQVSWTLRNQGTGDATGTWYDYLFLSNDNIAGDSDDQFFGSFSFSGTIAAGATLTRVQSITLPISMEGNRWVVIRTDGNNAIYEHANEGNNLAIDDRPVDVRLSPLPNLVVSSVTAPPTAFSSQQALVEWVVTNTGTGPTNASIWYDLVYLSTDDVLDAQDLLLGSSSNSSYLDVQESYVNSATVTMPRGIDGDYRFIVVTDGYNHVYEHNSEGDNSRASSVTDVQLTPPPDLQVTSVNAPTQAFSGQPVNLSWTVTNLGPGRTLESSWVDYVYMSDDTNLDGADRFLGALGHGGILNSGAGYTAPSTAFNLPIGVAGDFYIFIRTDAHNQVFEHAFEGNNTGYDAVPLHINLTPPPDLVVSGVNAPSSALANHLLSVTYSVANEGATATPNSYWEDRLYLSQDPVLSLADDIVLGTVGHYGALEPGDDYQGSFQSRLPQAISGTYYAIVVSDHSTQVFEIDRTNNVSVDAGAITIESRPPDLLVDSFTAPSIGESGATILVNYSVRNSGAGDTVATAWNDWIILSSDSIRGNGDDRVLLETTHNGLLNAGESYLGTNVLVSIPHTVATGSYQLFFVTDARDHVYEGAGNSNNDSPPIPISIVQTTADLQVTSIGDPPAALQAGDQFTVDWTVQNFGVVETNAAWWNDRVYLSPDSDLGDGDDVYLGALQRNGALAPNASYAASRSFEIPSNLQGTYYLFVTTDADNRVIEGAQEGNNTASAMGTVTISLRPAPDLQVTSVEAPATGFAGQPFSLTWTVKNFGPGATTGSWYDTLYMSLDQVLDNADTFLGYRYRPENLGVNASYTRTESINIPPGMAGAFYVFVRTDAGNQIDERANESNNVGYDGASMLVSLLPPADLVVGTIDVPVNGVPGRNITIDYTVENQGTNPAQGFWYDALYLSEDDHWDISDLLVGRVGVSASVAAGGSYSRSLTAPAPGVDPGQFHVIVRSDILNYLPELSDANNLKASLDRVAMDAEELILGVPSEYDLPGGASAYYKLDVSAGETVRFVLDSLSNDGDTELFVRYGAMPSRARFDFASDTPFQADQTLTVPADQAGTYYVLVYRRSVSGSPHYSLTANLVPFSISEVTASDIGNLGRATVKIDGARFNASTMFSIVSPGGTVLLAEQSGVENSTRAYATFNLAFQATGLYTLQATQGDTTVMLEDALNVLPGDGANIITDIEGADTLRPNRAYSFKLFYANAGDTDTAAPLILMRSRTGTPIATSNAGLAANSTLVQVLGLASDGPTTVFRPGLREGMFFYFQANSVAQGVDVQALPISIQDTRTISDDDWILLEGSVRPANLSDEDWAPFWANIRTRVGTTWGDYVGFLNRLAELMDSTGQADRDVRAMMATLYAEHPDFQASTMVSGILRDSVTGLPVPNVELGLFEVVPGEQNTRLVGQTVTDSNGYYSFSGLFTGRYHFIVGDDSANQALCTFDIDRDGADDQQPPTLDVEVGPDITNHDLWIRRTPDLLGLQSDVNPQVLQDSSGNAHLFWVRYSRIWHARHDGSAWIDAAPLPDSFGADYSAAYSANLIDGTTPGLIVMWSERNGADNSTELMYSVGKFEADGSVSWSDPVQLTDNQIAEMSPTLSTDSAGQVTSVFERVDETADDDSDLYQSQFVILSQDLTFSSLAPFSGEVGEAATSGSWQFGYSFKGGGHSGGLLGKLAKLDLKLRGSGSYSAAKDLDLQANASVDFSPGETPFGPGKVKGKVVGSFGYKGKWTAKGSRDDCEYYFVNASLKVDGGGELEYEIPLEWFVSKTPPTFGLPGTIILVLLRQTGMLQVDLGLAVRLTVQAEVSWTQPDGPPVDLRLPDSGIAYVALTGGLFGKAKGALLLGWEIKAYGAVTGRYQIYPNPGLDGSPSGFLGVDIQSPSGYILRLRTSADDLTTLDEDSVLDILNGETDVELLYDPTSLLGLGMDYSDASGSAVFADVLTDVTRESAPSQWTSPSGQRYLLWAKNVNPTSGLIGSTIQVSTLDNGNWSAPVTIPGSTGYSNSPRMAFGDGGEPVVVWSQADSTGEISEENFVDALNNSELYYSRLVSGNWTSASLVASTAGADYDPALGSAPDGSVVLAWRNQNGDERHLWSSSWSGAAWTSPMLVADADVLSRPAFATLGGTLNLIWSQDTNADPTLTVGALYSSELVSGVWTTPTALVPTLSPTFAASLAPVALGGAIQTTAGPFGLKPDPEYCPCDKINERTQGVNEGCGSTVEFDEETCTRTTVYKPCVVQPRDPNDIVNPEGFGEEHWIRADQKIPYQIRFENAADATAPAQVVQITQTLDPDLNPSSFRLTTFGFDNQTFEVPENKAFYSTRLDLTETRGYFVDVVMGIDISARQAFFTMTTIDPVTGEQPLDADVGFLPVNDATGQGEGFVSYTIRPRSSVVTGTRIDAGLIDEDHDYRASIVFDTEGPILTPSVFNTLDADKPTSSVAALPVNAAASEFEVAWSGSDAGSGLALFDIFVSIDGGDYQTWLQGTDLTQAIYAGDIGHTYAFFSVAIDNAGNIENDPAVADTQTTTPGGVASIGDFVWHDTDGDGTQDAGEAGMEGVTVTLYLAADDSVIDTTLTDAQGAYAFTGLSLANQYYLEFEALPGYAFSPTGQSLDPNLDSDAHVVTGLSPVFNVTNGENDQWDAGLFFLGSISGTVWSDLNGDGAKDTDEDYLEGWAIYLDSNDNGEYDAANNEPRVLTDANGAYAFPGLRPGTYIVAQEIPPGWEQTFPGPAGASSTETFGAAGFRRLYTFSGSTAELAAPSEVFVNTALSTADCGCHRPTTETAANGGSVTTTSTYHPWSDLIELDAYRADPRFAGVDGRGSSVVVIDTGIDADHSFFGPDADGNGVADRIVYQWDFADRDGDATDRTGHGSHVSSTIGSQDARYAGMAPGVDIISLKVFGDNGRGYFSYVEQALDWVIQHAAQYHITAVNLSVGDGLNWNSPIVMHGLGDELAVLANMNVITVAAAGNSYAIYESEGLAYPAADPNALSVGAVWDGDRGGPWSFGSFGTDYTTGADRITSFSQRDGNDLDIFAVGAVVGGANATGGVAWLRGTSMATPQVTGAVVLAQQIAEEHLGRRLALSEVRTLLRSSGVLVVDGDDENDSVRNTGLTSYRLDVHAFASAVLAYDGSLPGSDGSDNPTHGGDGSTGPQTGRPYRYTVALAAEENREDVNFGDRVVAEDQIPPTSSVSALPTYTTSTSFNVSWSGSDNAGGSGLASYTIYVSDNGGAYSAWLTDTTDTSALYAGADGHTYAFYSVATDVAGNTEAAPGAADASTTVDATVPTSSVSALPTYTTSTSFTVNWSGSDNAGGSGLASYTIYVSDNGGSYSAWLTDTTSTSALYAGADGHSYGFYSVATDNAGNTEAAPGTADASTTVDATAPNSSVAALPTYTTSTSFNVSWSGSDNAGGSGLASYTIYVSDNGGAYSAWLTATTSTSSLYAGADGHTYAFYSVATDVAGNTEAAPGTADATTTVDATVPTSSVSALATYSTSTSFTVNWSGSDNAGGSGLASYTIYVSENGGSYTAVLTGTTATSMNFIGTETFTYSFYSVATDAAGNTEAAPGTADATTTVDATAPTSSVSALPTYSTSASFLVSWSGSDNAGGSGLASYTIYVSDNGGAYGAWLTGITSTSALYAGVDGHTYAFYSVATDVAGNTEAAPGTADATTTVDATAPTSSVNALPAYTTATSFNVSWSGSDNAGGSGLASYTIYVSDNGGTYTALLTGTTSTSTTFAGSVGHTYRFYSTAVDVAGNVEAAPGSPDATTTVVAPLTVTAVGPVSPDPRNTAVASVEVTFSAAITAGSFSSSDVTLTRNAGANLITGAQTISFVGGTTYRINNLIGLTGTDGSYLLTVDATTISDSYGLAGQGNGIDSWLMDTVRPTSTIQALPPRSSSTSLEIVVLGNDPSAGNGSPPSGVSFFDIFVSIDSGPYSLWRSGSFSDGNTQTYVAECKHTYDFRSVVRDAAGNVEIKGGSTSDTRTYVPDLLAPDTQVTNVDSTTSTLGISIQGRDLGGGRLVAFDLYVSVDESVPEKRARIVAGAPNGSGIVLATTQYQALADGSSHSYRFYTVGIDDVGNTEGAPTAPADVSLTQAFAAAPMRVSSIDVQRGEVQRSKVQYLDAVFTRQDQLAALIDSIQDGDASNDRMFIKRFNLDGSGAGALVSLAGKVTPSGSQAAFDFGTGGLSDGYYEFALDFDGNGSIDQSLHFYRLQGDFNGDRRVDARDMSLLFAAIGKTGPGLLWDLNGDGKVDMTDRTLLSGLFGRKLGDGLAIDD
ncbi:MAG: CARDB domain-containing protein [Planctomycetales bacterium]